jgi:hypothetical protein
MSKVALNARDLTTTWPDGPVNRHVQTVLYVDTDTGAVTAEPQLDQARREAFGPDGTLPAAQLVGAPGADPGELDRLRAQVQTLTDQLGAKGTTRGSA